MTGGSEPVTNDPETLRRLAEELRLKVSETEKELASLPEGSHERNVPESMLPRLKASLAAVEGKRRRLGLTS